ALAEGDVALDAAQPRAALGDVEEPGLDLAAGPGWRRRRRRRGARRRPRRRLAAPARGPHERGKESRRGEQAERAGDNRDAARRAHRVPPADIESRNRTIASYSDCATAT